MRAIKRTVQDYWETLSSEERREILVHVVTKKELPIHHPIFQQDDLPHDCVRAWLEETVAKEDFDIEYINESCGC